MLWGMRRALLLLVLAACPGPQQPQQSTRDVDHDGVPDVADKCAYQPGPEANSGCPESKSTIDVQASGAAPSPTTPTGPAADRDGDGVGDATDACPDDPEDRDGFDDEDGCPDPDNDQDGILDVADKCPNEAEVKDGQTDDDGCPP